MNKERLLKLADHLETGKLKADVFNFKVLYQEDYPILGTGTCGTNACALGECPTIFDEWEISKETTKGRFSNIIFMYPTLKGINSNEVLNPPFVSAIIFFEITEEEANILFMPSEDIRVFEDLDSETYEKMCIIINDTEFYGIPGNSTRNDVAKHIRNFVELKENERISRSS